MKSGRSVNNKASCHQSSSRGSETHNCDSRRTVWDNRWEIQATTQWDYLIVAVLQIRMTIQWTSKVVDGLLKLKATEFIYTERDWRL